MKLRKKKPTVIHLHGWNKQHTTAKCPAEDFDKVFADRFVIHDLDTDEIYASFEIGARVVVVFRDSEK